MDLGKIWLVFLGIMFSGLYLAIVEKVTFPELLAFPTAGIFVLLMGTVYVRAGSAKSMVMFLPIKAYSLLRVPVHLAKNESYMDNVECFIEDDKLETQVSYLGLETSFSVEVEDAIDEYLDMMDEGEIVLRKDTVIDLFESSIHGANCSTCVHSDKLNTSVDVQWVRDDRVSWTMTLCANCWERVIKEQLRTLSEDTEFESKVVIDQL